MQCFTNQISTDGYAVHFQLARAAKKQSTELKLGDFNISEIEEYFTVCAVDPGRKHIFTASYDYREDERTGKNTAPSLDRITEQKRYKK